MRIGRKLAMTYGLMSVLLVGLVFGAKLIVDRIDHDFDVLHHEFSAVTEELNNLRVASVRIVSSANQFAFLASVTSELTDDGNSQTDEMKELNDGIAAFNDAFARYSRAAEDSPNVEALNLKAVGAAGSALINESRHLADRAALSGTHFEQLDSSDRLEKLEHSLRQIITHTKANAHAAFEVRRHELGKMTGTISKLSWVSKRYGGTGLGLAISQRFVEMLGGRLTIDSELGAGSCFTVWIPDEEIALHDSIGSGPRVLIIEDSLTDISLLERYLKPFQFRIEVARDGEQGLLLAREVKPALILLDIQLPGIDGIGVLKALRADADLETIPVIITSVHDAREEALQLGARGYITKPLDRHVLQAAIAANLPKPKTGNISAGSPALTRAAVG